MVAPGLDGMRRDDSTRVRVSRWRGIPAIRLATLIVVGLTMTMRLYAQSAEVEVFARAESLFADREWKQAVSAFDGFIRQFPKSASVRTAYLRLGQAYVYLAQDAAARQSYAKVVELDPNDAYASQAISLWGNLYVERYQYREAMQMCQEVMRAYPGTRAAEMAHYLLGIYAYSDRQTDDAIRAFSDFLHTYPKSVYRESTLRQLISILVYASRYDDAEKALNEQLAVSPQDVDLVEQLSEVYRKQERYDDAIRLLSAAAQRQPKDATLLEALGEVYAAKGDRARALETWMTMASSAGDSYDVHQRLGSVLKQNGFYEEAAREYEAALRLQPTYTYLYVQLADIHKIRGDTQGALRVYLDALSKLGIQYGGREPIVTAIGELYPASKRAEGYMRAATQVRERYGAAFDTDAVALLTVSELSFASGQVAASLAGFEKLAGVYSDGGMLLTNYATELAERGDAENAARFYETSLRLFPMSGDSALRYVALGKQYVRLRRWDDAVTRFLQATSVDPQRRQIRDVDLLIAETMLRGKRRPADAAAHLNAVQDLPGLAARRGDVRLLLAEAALALGNYDEAAKQLDAFPSGDADEDARALFLRAEAEFFQGNYHAAAEKYREVVAVDPSSTVATDALGRISLLRDGGSSDSLTAYVAALQERLRGNLTGATTALRALIGAASTTPIADYARMTLADVALESNDAESALVALNVVAEGRGSLAGDALMRIATIRRERGETQAAMDAYEQLLEQFPRGAYSVEARENLKALASTQP
jgi:tetratricopeptide (TPR) repeat protein